MYTCKYCTDSKAAMTTMINHLSLNSKCLLVFYPSDGLHRIKPFRNNGHNSCENTMSCLKEFLCKGKKSSVNQLNISSGSMTNKK